MQNPQHVAPSQEAAVVLTDPDAYEHALHAQHERTLGAEFARTCLKRLGWSLSVNVIQAIVIGALAIYIVFLPREYFATEAGRITPLYPTDKPVWSESDVRQFGADTISKAFTLDFVHYRDQMTAAAADFSEEGFTGYNRALSTDSNTLSLVKDKRMNLTNTVEPGVITRRGVVGGRYTWEFQYPVTLRLQGQNTSTPPLRYIFTLRIQQADPRLKPRGLEVTQTITNNAG
ncbi:DotI/IcmL/TraM family protein [Pantoea sp. SS70]|uniref:DotI/IcmL/TraM family protein n=1 Tax=Pantoea sp. SS70 TaxID=3024247 RepID=UPI0024531C34|nr:DotI/IcmL/TraM family protein [Pantoea sp. SS70]WGK60017.1 DotI/IcmL/TraM family protein [Pantoea sp. SS70]